MTDDVTAHQVALTHVLGEIKRHQLGARVSYIEISSRAITLHFDGIPPGQKKSDAETALERAREEESIMYGSAGT